MDFVILGSGGAVPTPRPFCKCKICQKARQGIGVRKHSSAFLKGPNFLIDCGEDIKESLNKEKIFQVDALFLTHWHPDHSFGLREVLEANYDFIHSKAKKTLDIYAAKKVFKQLAKHFPILGYLVNKKLCRLVELEHLQKVAKKGVIITSIGYVGKKSDTFGFLIETNKKMLFYAPCDTIKLKEKFVPKKLDFLVHELGLFSYAYVKTELSFPNMIKRITRTKPRKTILTHIEELEIKTIGEKKFKKIEKDYSSLNLKMAFDGMTIKL